MRELLRGAQRIAWGIVVPLSLLLSLFVALVVTGCGTGCGSVSAKALKVVSFAPDSATDSLKPRLRIQFDKPVVAPEQVGKALADAPIDLRPSDVRLSAHWLDRHTLVAEPRGELRPSTRYKALLRGELAHRSGAFEFKFVVRPLKVTGVRGVDPDNLPPEPEIGLLFNQEIVPAQVAERCWMRAGKEGPKVSLTSTARQSVDVIAQVKPDKRLEQGQDYELLCEGLTGAKGNAVLEGGHRVTMRTYPELRVVSMTPIGRDAPADDVRVEVHFATAVPLSQVRDALVARPAVRGLEQGWMDASGTQYSVVVNLAAQTDYKFRVRRGMNDVYGQRLAKRFEQAFETGNAAPRLNMETGIFAVEPASQGYPVWSRNLSRFQVDCARVPKRKVVDLLTSTLNYDPWYSAGDRKIDWGTLGLKKHNHAMTVDAPKNNWQLEKLQLHELCGGRGERGLFLTEVHSDQVEPRNRYHRPERRVLANVTNLGVLLKVGSQSGLLWITGITDGAPVGGARVTVYSPRGKVVHRGVSDSSGLVRLPGSARMLPKTKAETEDEYGSEYWGNSRAQRLIAVVEKGDDFAVVDGNWSNGIQIWNFGVSSDYGSAQSRVRGFIQSDRGIYRPGETVHFKGLARELREGRALAVPKAKKVLVQVEDARGSSVFRRNVDLSAFGGFAFDFKLPKAASVGDYHVRARVGRQTFRERFMVEEFRKVTFELDLDRGARHSRLGAKLKFDLKARYLFGAPVQNANVRWTIQRRQHAVRFERFAKYTFEDHAAEGRYSWWYDHGAYGLSFVSEGEGLADKKGRYQFTTEDPDHGLKRPYDYLLQATVTDDTDQSVTKRSVVTAHATNLYVGLHAQEFVQAVGMPFSVNVVAVKTDGVRASAKAKLTVVREARKCTYRGEYRAARRCTTQHSKVLEREFAVAETGAATQRIMPKEPGEYIIRVQVKDDRGQIASASTYAWVLGEGEAFWSGDESARMSLIASKAEYEPGETARLVARTDIPAPTALVTLERDGILDARVQRLSSASEGLSIPMTDAHAPNVFASVVFVAGRRGKGDRYRPRFAMGVVDLKVSSAKQRLAVEVTTERKNYKPGETVKGVVRVKAQGRPVKAEVALAASDEGVLQLIAYKTPDPMNSFYKSFGLGVDAGTNWNRIARLNDPSVVDVDEGGDAGADNKGRVRSRFVSSAYWEPALLTNAEGEVPFSFEAPDNLTAFRLMAVAADQGSRFGSSDSRITVKKPLLAKPVLPRFLTQGDDVQLGVVVHNYTGQSGKVTVAASARGASLHPATRTIEVPVGGQERVNFKARARRWKKARFSFQVSMGEHADALEVSLPVNRPVVEEERVLARGVLAGGDASETTVALAYQDGVIKGESELVVSVDRTGLAELEPALRYLVEYPYGCLEQTLSRFIPLTKVRELARASSLRKLRGPKLDAFVRAGAAKVVRHQVASGHFSLWPTGPADPALTVYAVHGLHEAKKAGVRVDERALKRGVHAMRQWATSSERSFGPGGETATVAMAAYLLGELGKPDAGLTARLFEARSGLPRYGKAFLVRALKGQDAEKTSMLVGELLAAVQQSGDTALVRESDRSLARYMSSDVRTTAIVVSALLDAAPREPIIERLVAGLRKAQNSTGRWYNTQENLYSIVALADYARTQSKGQARVTLEHEGSELAKRRLQGHEVLTFRRKLSRLKEGSLKLSASGPVRYTVRLREMRRDPKREALANGFAVQREYYDAETDETLSEFRVNQLVRVRLRVTTEKERPYVALVDPLPAGLEPVNERLDSSEQARRPASGGRLGWWRRGFEHRELRDDRFMAFADRLSEGTHLVEYVARATFEGGFEALPAHVEAMYDPDVRGRSSSARVKVRR